MNFCDRLCYPLSIETEQQLNIFFDYVIHEWIDFNHFNFAVLKFSGVSTDKDYCRRKVIVNVPLHTKKEFQHIIGKNLDHDIDGVLNRLSSSISLGCDLEVHLLINCKDVTISPTNKEREVNSMFIPEVEKIIHRTSERGEFFTVVWKDKTSTTVKLMEGEQSDEYTAFLYAVGKKMFSNKGVARQLIEEKKKVFEDEVNRKSADKANVRRQKQMERTINSNLNCNDIAGIVYAEGFVSPALISKTLFRRNGGK